MRLLILGLTIAVVTSCAVIPRSHEAPLSTTDMSHWTLSGKLGVRYNGEAHSAHFSWQNENSDFAIRLHGPLGQGSAKLSHKQNTYTLEANGEKHQAYSAEALMSKALGWSFPTEDMVWWVRGLSSPHSPVMQETRDTQGNLQHLEQHGWQIHYKRYQQVGALLLPYKLVASHKELHITLLLKQWTYQ